MTYARDKICFDADSHLMPRPDFLSAHADPKYREALYIDGGPNGGERFAKWFGAVGTLRVLPLATPKSD